MGRFVNPDNSAFQAALNSRIYVDKTGLIVCMNEVLDSTDAYICNSRPRRFGKSYAANMLAAYYSKGAESEKMFSDLEIGQSEDFKKHLNKYDVIHIDVQWFLINCEDADNVVPYITRVVLDELREVYPEILRQEVVSLPDALSLVKDKTGRKFIKCKGITLISADSIIAFYMIFIQITFLQSFNLDRIDPVFVTFHRMRKRIPEIEITYDTD